MAHFTVHALIQEAEAGGVRYLRFWHPKLFDLWHVAEAEDSAWSELAKLPARSRLPRIRCVRDWVN